MSIPPETFIPIPFGLLVVMWAEFILFVPFSIIHYMGGFKPFWGTLTQNGLGRTIFWSGEMLNGVGAWVLMFMLGSALWQGSVSVVEIEILFLSHALWYGVIIAMFPPGHVGAFFCAINPHTYLFIGVLITGYDLPRPICLAVCALVMLFGIYRRVYQIPKYCYGVEYSNFTPDVMLKHAKDGGIDEFEKLIDAADRCFGAKKKPVAASDGGTAKLELL